MSRTASSSVIREYPGSPAQRGHKYPAWTSSIGPLLLAEAGLTPTET